MKIERDQILRCACELFLNEGIDGFSMRKLARCVGCTAPALYRHYESKEGVIRDVVGEAYRQFTQYLYRALEGRDAAERFILAGKSYFAFAVEQPALYEIIYMPNEILGGPSVRAGVADQACAIGQFWADRVREMMDEGYLKDGDPSRVSYTLWAHAHGMISIYHKGLLPIETLEDFRVEMTGSFLRVMNGMGTELWSEVEKRFVEGGRLEGAGV
jgi:AcrR family transcriptional regulator